MSYVTDISDRINRSKYGQEQFMLCGCNSGEGVLPVVSFDAEGPFIIALLCPICENEVAVVNGRPVTP